jgi:choline dehydrogenase-like flavoprotein
MYSIEAFDAVVVGSGMTGALAAKELCHAGLKVLVLEAGPSLAVLRSDDTGSHEACGDQHIQSKCYAYSKNTRQYFVNDLDNPYSFPPGHPFSWIRARTVGGRSLLWAGHCYRMTDQEFMAPEEDGVGESWPITYEEIAPYYDKAEQILRVKDVALGGGPHGADPSIYDERHFREAFAKVGRKLIRARVSRSDSPGGAQAPCLHCGQVGSSCSRPVASPDSTLAEALKTGHLTLRTQSPVRHIATDEHGRPTRVCGIDQKTGQEFEVKGRLVFLCASALESTRILLNSASQRHPDGLGNSSGVLGHYLMDHVSGIALTGHFERDRASRNTDSSAGMFYVPRPQNLGNHRSNGFLRGYGYQVFTMRADHELLPCGGTKLKSPEQTGADSGNATIRIVGFGEMLPHYDNYVEIDKEGKKDAFGIPILRIDCSLKDNEKVMAKHILASAQEMLESAGVRVIDVQSGPAEPGLAIHEAGTCRMGLDSKTSVLNSYNHCHDAPNVFVTDGSCFPSIGVQNPVLTMVALTIRACRHAVEQLRKGEI